MAHSGNNVPPPPKGISCQSMSEELMRTLDLIQKNIKSANSRSRKDTQFDHLRIRNTSLSLELNELTTQNRHLQDLFELGDAEMLKEIDFELQNLLSRSHALMISSLFYENMDHGDAYIEIRAGSGGTEACDWAAMLAKMYTKWGHINNLNVTVVNESLAEIAGVKAATLFIKGRHAFGYSQFESGIHRLVRVSPFDRGGSRHTSFASVQVSPHIDDSVLSEVIEIDPSDLEITTTRSQGAGGQHVNKTESAVRIVHIPTKIVVTCQKERSQHRNKITALAMLKAKLYDLDRQKKALDKSRAHMNLPENSWGSQIRSYVLNPYQLVKDTRTGYEEKSARRVLDGEVQE
ncbi:peptide chain release factor 2 [Hysterangium stoloniferum]|nr:peptide chain release factor 2 [Hysterangium stoloniferum]